MISFTVFTTSWILLKPGFLHQRNALWDAALINAFWLLHPIRLRSVHSLHTLLRCLKSYI